MRALSSSGLLLSTAFLAMAALTACKTGSDSDNPLLRDIDDNDGSGPGNSASRAHEIIITAPEIDAVSSSGDGLYARRVTVDVTDRSGRPVADGTRVSLKVIDSIIAYGTDGAMEEGSNLLVSGAPLGGNFTNTISRQFEALDASNALVLIQNAGFPDRQRQVRAVLAPNTLEVDRAYSRTMTGLRYWVGKSAYGTAILGEDGTSLDAGTVRTLDGKAVFTVRYPTRDFNGAGGLPLLGMGCRQYSSGGTYPPDPRFPGETYSGQVVLMAEVLSNLEPESPRTRVVTPDFCYSGIAGGSIKAVPAAAASQSLPVNGGRVEVEFRIVDGGDGIPMAFAPVSSSVRNLSGVRARISNNGMTDADGRARVVLTSSEARAGKGTVRVFTDDAELEIKLEVR